MMRGKVTNWNSYDNNDPENILVRKLFLDVVFNAYKKLLKEIDFKTPVSILELGSGTGYTTLQIAKKIPTKKITIVDNNQTMLNIAKKTLKPVQCKKEFINKDLFKLKLKEKFDLVHSAGLVEHFGGEKKKQIFKLHAQLTKPKGYCIIYAPTPTISYRVIRKIYELLRTWQFTDEIPLKPNQLLSLIKNTGLIPKKTNYFWNHYWLTEIGVLAKKN
ncbi:class I SAM-dependent methyltransferase [Patescibacteria group bacterium]